MSLQIEMLYEPKPTSHMKPTRLTPFGTGPFRKVKELLQLFIIWGHWLLQGAFPFTKFQHLMPNQLALHSRFWGSLGSFGSCPEHKTNSLTISICTAVFGVLFLFCFVF